MQLDEVDARGDRSPGQIKDDAIAHTSDVDPLQLEMEPLLVWLGAKLDD